MFRILRQRYEKIFKTNRIYYKNHSIFLFPITQTVIFYRFFFDFIENFVLFEKEPTPPNAKIKIYFWYCPLLIVPLHQIVRHWRNIKGGWRIF